VVIPTQVRPEVFLATMFSGAGHADQAAGLLIASSSDGVAFQNIRASSEPIYTPAGGVRDPILLYWHGQWHLVYSYGPNVAPLLFRAQSSDLLHWTPVGSLRLAADTATWGDQAHWSAVTTMTDAGGEPLVQGNSFVAVRDGAYVMAFNGMAATVYYLRTSASLTSGWSTARPLDLDPRVNNGDSENLVCLADGSLRFYLSNGNALKKVIWYMDSADDGVSWTSPRVVTFSGFGPAGVNWAQVVRITDPAALAALAALAANHAPPS
jgi:hypothetical protein